MSGFYRDLKTNQEVSKVDIFNFLKAFDEKKEGNYFLVFQDINSILNDAILIHYIKSIAFKNIHTENYNITIFIVSNNITFPLELKNLAVTLKPPFPNQEEINNQIFEFLTDLNISISQNKRKKLAVSLLGLSKFEISRILNINYQATGTLDTLDKNIYNQILAKNSVIKIINERVDFNSIGGVSYIKDYIYQRTKIFQTPEKARHFGVDLPKRIFIIGNSGSGKSSIVKAIAYSFNVILIQLNLQKIISKDINESEKLLLNTLKNIELMGKTVVWLNRLDDLFLDSHNRDHVIHLLGITFTWMRKRKELKSISFSVVTANNLKLIPHEIFRSNSFDEIFKVEYPNIHEREEIFSIHLKRRNQNIKNINLSLVSQKSEGLKGSEIETVIRKSIEKAFIDSERKIKTEDFLNQIEIIKENKNNEYI